MTLQPKSVLARARACIRLESEALMETATGLGPEFVDTARAVAATIAAGHKLIFTGVGKSAHIAQKLTGTFNSTGAPSCFLDATQAQHGDLGLCTEGDLAILLSNSGQTEEILRLMPLLKRLGAGLVAFTARADSDLAKNAAHRLIYRVPREACPLALAPTASTTAALALGDALAMVLLEARGLTRDDFAKLHPGGNLGGLLLKVIASYNAGPAPITAWNTRYDQSDPLLYVESLPYWETRGYLPIILRNYWIYEDRGADRSISRRVPQLAK